MVTSELPAGASLNSGTSLDSDATLDTDATLDSEATLDSGAALYRWQLFQDEDQEAGGKLVCSAGVLCVLLCIGVCQV